MDLTCKSQAIKDSLSGRPMSSRVESGNVRRKIRMAGRAKKRGKAAVAARDPKEINRHLATTAAKTKKERIAGKGARARKTPRPVAIPLPPLNFRKKIGRA